MCTPLAVSTSGTVLDPAGIPVTTAMGDQFEPATASSGPSSLIVWRDQRNGFDSDIYGARVSRAGSLLDPAGRPVSTASSTQHGAQVAWDGDGGTSPCGWATWMGTGRRSGGDWEATPALSARGDPPPGAFRRRGRGHRDIRWVPGGLEPVGRDRTTGRTSRLPDRCGVRHLDRRRPPGPAGHRVRRDQPPRGVAGAVRCVRGPRSVPMGAPSTPAASSSRRAPMAWRDATRRWPSTAPVTSSHGPTRARRRARHLHRARSPRRGSCSTRKASR